MNKDILLLWIQMEGCIDNLIKADPHIATALTAHAKRALSKNKEYLLSEKQKAQEDIQLSQANIIALDEKINKIDSQPLADEAVNP